MNGNFKEVMAVGTFGIIRLRSTKKKSTAKQKKKPTAVTMMKSWIGSKDQNFTILINDIIKKIDEYSKIVKPAFFDFLEVSKI